MRIGQAGMREQGICAATVLHTVYSAWPWNATIGRGLRPYSTWAQEGKIQSVFDIIAAARLSRDH
jgi:hypothetical protein